ncbi:MAG: hypothetical protein JF609_01650 [Verrucomicrobia bacterium]|nr:hypothetical protein [Verrucomicrobiota bacterium]
MLPLICAAVLTGTVTAHADSATLVKFEAESGTLGTNFVISNSVSPAYITITTDFAGNYPSNAARVATYSVTFPAAGTYDLYAHVRVGSGTFNDDSMFYGNGFGVKDPTLSSDWILVNGLAAAGFTAATNIVTGGGTAGSGIWKWIDLSQFAPGPAFTVTNGNLTQTFQIGARENGLDMDAFASGLNGVTFTVADLDAGTGGTLPTGNCAINWNDVRQQIDGFGGGVVFLDAGLDPVTDANMDTLFNTNTVNQLALTLLRVRIDPITNWGTSLSDAKKAVVRGAGVLATPWTPPASMKDNGMLTNGSLLSAQYANYASYLKNFAGYMASNSAPLRAISVQNEPDWPATYESCLWSGTQFLNFFRTNAAAIGSIPVMMPESLGYNFNYSDATLNDPVAMTNVSLIGGHLYGVTTIQDYTNAHNKGKPTWMTEFLLNDQSIESAIVTARQIHDCLTTANMSAYIWWKCLGDANGLLNASGAIQKRGYVMSQFSRFIRPGHYRIGATNVGPAFISAYKNPNSGQFVIVAINTSSTTVNQTFTLTNFSTSTVTPWITSASQSLAVQATVAVTNSSFTYLLPPTSIISFAGQLATNTPPSLGIIQDQAINPGMTLVITNAASDTDSPPQTLTYTLLNSPTNATVNPTNGIFIWRPLLSQAGKTNLVVTRVTDSGAPPLSATNSFIVIVNPITLPTLIASTSTNGKINMVISGATGPDYTLLISSNLLTWQVLFTTNSPVPPFSFNDTMIFPAGYYRAQIGP